MNASWPQSLAAASGSPGPAAAAAGGVGPSAGRAPMAAGLVPAGRQGALGGRHKAVSGPASSHEGHSTLEAWACLLMEGCLAWACHLVQGCWLPGLPFGMASGGRLPAAWHGLVTWWKVAWHRDGAELGIKAQRQCNAAARLQLEARLVRQAFEGFFALAQQIPAVDAPASCDMHI
eukprot:scaffold282440_cov16-Tisochrysis_lutea.AAC.1